MHVSVKNLLFSIVIFTAVFLLLGCTASDETHSAAETDAPGSVSEAETWEDAYTLQQIQTWDGYKSPLTGNVSLLNADFTDSENLFLRITGDKQIYQIHNLADGLHTDTVTIADYITTGERQACFVASIIPLTKDRLLFVGVDDHDFTRTVLKLKDREGNVLAETETHELRFPQDGGTPHDVLTAEDGTILLYRSFDDMPMLLLDASLNLITVLPWTNDITDMFRASDGSLYLVSYNHTYRVNETDGTLEHTVLYQSTDAANRASVILYGSDGAYFVGQEHVVFQTWDGNETVLFPWEHTMYSRSQFDFLRVLPDHRFLVRYADHLTGETALGLLVPAPDTVVRKKEVLSLASIGLDADNRILIAESVAAFNREQEHYRIVYTDFDALVYGDARTEQNVSSTADQSSFEQNLIEDFHSTEHIDAFESALLDGGTFDLYVFGPSYNGRENLTEKNLFLDLSDSCDAFGLLDGVRGVMKEPDGNIYALPMVTEISTLITLAQTHPSDQPMNHTALKTVYDKLGNGETLFSDDVHEELLAIAVSDAVDWTAGTSSFASEEFSSIYPMIAKLEAYANNFDRKNIPDIHSLIRADLGRIANGQIVERYPIQALAAGNLKFFKWSITRAADLQYLFFYMDGLDYTLCGYPSKNGGSIYFEPNVLLSVSAECPHTDAAMEYLSMMLSDRIQCSPALTERSFPVTERAVQSLLPGGYYHYRNSQSLVYGHLYPPKITDEPLTGNEKTSYHTVIAVDDAMRQNVVRYLCSESMQKPADPTVLSIITEEMSAWNSGVRSFEDAAKNIDSRVWIYLNE